MKKLAIILTVLVVISGFGYTLYVLTGEPPRAPDEQAFPDRVDQEPTRTGTSTNATGSSSVQVVEPIIPTVSTKITLEEVLKVPDVYPDPMNEGRYLLKYHFPATEDESAAPPPFIIEYLASTEEFNIALLVDSLADTRLDVEQYLMDTFELSPSELCGLTYMVTVPIDVSETYAGTDLRFSGCTGAVALP
jgi:hypothetical protein